MNRNQIKQAVRNIVGTVIGSITEANILMLDNFVTQAANDVAKRTNCLFTSATGNIVSGTSDYSTGTSIYAVKRVTTGDGSGNTVRLEPITLDDLNRWASSLGLISSTGAYAAGIPAYYLSMAASFIRVVKVPNYNVTNGLVIEGEGYPSTTWSNATDACPLPLDAHMAVVYRAAILLADNDTTPEVVTKVRVWRDAYATETAQTLAVIQQHESLNVASGLDSSREADVAYLGGS